MGTRAMSQVERGQIADVDANRVARLQQGAWALLADALLVRILVFNLVRFSALCMTCALIYGSASLLQACAPTLVSAGVLLVTLYFMAVLRQGVAAAAQSAALITASGRGGGAAAAAAALDPATAAAECLPPSLFAVLLIWEAGLLQCQRFVAARVPEVVVSLVASQSWRRFLRPPFRWSLYLTRQVAAQLARRLRPHLLRWHQRYLTADKGKQAPYKVGAEHPVDQLSSSAALKGEHVLLSMGLHSVPFDVWNSHLRHMLNPIDLVHLSACSRAMYHAIHGLPRIAWDGDLASVVALHLRSPYWQQGFMAWHRTLHILLPRTNKVPLELFPLASGVSARCFSIWSNPTSLGSLQPHILNLQGCSVTQRILESVRDACRHLILINCFTPPGFRLDLSLLPLLRTLTVLNTRPVTRLALEPRGLHRLSRVTITGPYEFRPSSFGPANEHVFLQGGNGVDLRHLRHATSVTLRSVGGIANLHCLQRVRRLTLDSPKQDAVREPLPALPSLQTVHLRCPPPWLLSSLGVLSHLTHVTITQTPWVRDVSPLARATEVNLHQCHGIKDITPLRCVHTVTIDDCQHVSDISVLTRVTHLALCNMDCPSLGRLASGHLRHLKLVGVEGVERLPRLPNLRRLHIQRCHSLNHVPIPTALEALTVKDCDRMWNLLSAAAVPELTVRHVDALVPGPLSRWIARSAAARTAAAPHQA